MSLMCEFCQKPFVISGKKNRRTKTCGSDECQYKKRRQWVMANRARVADSQRKHLRSEKRLAYMRDYVKANRERCIEYGRKYQKSNVEKMRAKNRAQYRKNPWKYKARKLVGLAVDFGILKRKPCEHCGETKVQGHHHDYMKPLDVTWLCVACHGFEHRKYK